MAGSFYRNPQASLVFGANSAAAFGNNLGPVGKIFSQILIFFVIGIGFDFAKRTIGADRSKPDT